MIAHAMADMTNTICGHKRETLRWALELWATVTNGGVVVYSAGAGGAKVAKANAFGDTNDPAKLTAITAELLHEHGLRASIEMDRPDNRLDVWVNHFPNDSHPNETPGIGIRSCRRGRFGERIVEDLNMPQARTLALALLDEPNATAQDIERMIGEVAR